MRRRPRRERRRLESGFDLNITSMMDMFTLILIFLLYFFDPNAVDPSAVRLAVSDQLAPSEAPPVVTVGRDAIRVRGQVVLGLEGGEVPASVPRDGRVIGPLVEAVGARPEDAPSRITIACDRATPYRLVADVLSSVQAAGYEDYQLLVETGDESRMTTP